MKCGGFPGPGVQHVVSANPMREFIHKDDSHVHLHFESFKDEHDKEYEDHTEHTLRKNVFKQNLRFVFNILLLVS